MLSERSQNKLVKELAKQSAKAGYYKCAAYTNSVIANLAVSVLAAVVLCNICKKETKNENKKEVTE